MGHILFVVNAPDRWSLDIPGVEIVSADSYLTDPQFSTMRQARVLNLCRSYRYQSLGYYVSLLAEARGHKPIPRASTVQDLKSQSIVKVVSSDLDELIQKSLAHLLSDSFELSIYFSRNVSKRYDRLARQLFNLFPAPLLRAYFKRDGERWTLESILPISANEIPDEHRERVQELVREYFERRTTAGAIKRKQYRYSMAILRSDDDPTPPSNEKALEKFADAGDEMGVDVELIDKEDYGRIAGFDALFIRQTTAVTNNTYRFARRAQAEGLVVIDDPDSIVRCTNKVFLAEVLARHHIASPRTEILHRDNVEEIRHRLGLPCVLKAPDSSFSLGVVKAETVNEFYEQAEKLLEGSEMLIAQEFLKTEFDWRVGIIDRRPLYACKYFMARGHWQIFNNEKKGRTASGSFETLPVEVIPRSVLKLALKAANLMGDGLYGVDIKEVNGKPYLIEVNDNPSIDAGVEDLMLREHLYERIMEVFVRRLDAMREGRQVG